MERSLFANLFSIRHSLFAIRRLTIAKRNSAFSRRRSPEVCKFVCPQKQRAHATLKRGRREDRVRAAPAVSCAKMHVAKSAHEHTGSAEAVRPSLRNGFTAYFVLSPVRPGLACHRRPQEAFASCELDTCHWGVRTTRLCRTLQPRSSVAALASIAPRPNVSDDGQRPFSRDGMARNKQMIWVWSQGKFLKIRNIVIRQARDDNSLIVGWAKRSVRTVSLRSTRVGTAQRAPLPTLRRGKLTKPPPAPFPRVRRLPARYRRPCI
jgi:hypothetical protein